MYIEPEILKDEWFLFSHYCPKPIMDILTDENITYVDARNLYIMLGDLGFTALATELNQKKLYDLLDAEHKARREVLPTDTQEVRKLTRTFINNVKSPGLKRLFATFANEKGYIKEDKFL